MFEGNLVRIAEFLFVCVLSSAVGRQLTDAELHRLPKLFHLDDYERCLSQENGLYCLGTFELSAEPSHPVLQLMKEHSEDRHTFNRTLLHRGYCVSQRCPERKSCMERNNFERSINNLTQKCDFERNRHDARKTYDFDRNSFRFERCVSKFARRHTFTARLSSLQYCITHEEHKMKLNTPLNDGQWIFLFAVVFIVQLNIVATIYDWTGCKGSSLLLSWSLFANWARFTRIDESALMKSLAPLQFSRLVMQWITIFAHTILTHFMVYVHNPEEMERYIQGYLGNLIRNGTSVVQIFILISCFLTALNFLMLVSKNSEINIKVIIKWIFKRLFRILPVYLLVLGFTTTWWDHSAEGPLWTTVQAESAICRRKFWTQVFFLNNLIEPSDLCLLQSWGLAIDMQLYIISLITIYILLKTKANGPKTLTVLFVLSVVLNVILAYFAGWEPMVRLIFPENLRFQFRKTPTMPLTHMSIWGNLPACFLGLFLGYSFFEMTKNAKVSQVIETRSTSDEKNNEERNVVVQDEIKKKEVAQNEVKRNEVVENGTKRDGFTPNEDVSNDPVQNHNKGNGTIEHKILSNGSSVHSKVALFERLHSTESKSNGHVKNDDEIYGLIQNNIVNHERHQNKIQTNGFQTIQNGIKEIVKESDKSLMNTTNDISIPKVRNRLKKQPERESIELNNNISPVNVSESNGLTEKDFSRSKKDPHDDRKERLGLKRMAFYLLRKADIFTLPCLLSWIYFGTYIETFESKPVIAIYVGVERIVFSGLSSMLLISLFSYDGFLRRVAAWNGWQAVGRLVYSLTVLHWCVTLTLAASRPQPVVTSAILGTVDWLATVYFTYILALPVCLLVELPAQKFFDILLNKIL